MTWESTNISLDLLHLFEWKLSNMKSNCRSQAGKNVEDCQHYEDFILRAFMILARGKLLMPQSSFETSVCVFYSIPIMCHNGATTVLNNPASCQAPCRPPQPVQRLHSQTYTHIYSDPCSENCSRAYWVYFPPSTCRHTVRPSGWNILTVSPGGNSTDQREIKLHNKRTFRLQSLQLTSSSSQVCSKPQTMTALTAI